MKNFHHLLSANHCIPPRCFKSLTPDFLFVTAQKESLDVNKMMEDWLKHLDRVMEKKKRNVLLILDNAPSHPNIQLINVNILQFFPPNTTSYCQPIDQGIIQANMKLKYRKRQVQHVLVEMDKMVQKQDLNY